MQHELIFFDKEPPTLAQRKFYLNPNNIFSPYYGFVGNKKAVDKLIRLDTVALGRYNHLCNDINFAFIGKSGCGKTELVRRHAKATGLPLVEISPKATKFTHDIFLEIEKACEQNDIPLEPMEDETYLLPPINVFIDEVHALNNYVVQGLLKATEQHDRILVTEKRIIVDCSNVHWLIATTDRGMLFDAFDTRFNKINLKLYSRHEISQIIQSSYEDWPVEACDMVAHYCPRMPREALSFAKEMELERNLNSSVSWKDVASKIAEENDIDSFGMSLKRLEVLKVLGQGPVASKRLHIMVGVKAEELENFILPCLLEGDEDQFPYVTVCNKGYTLTQAGKDELEKRGLFYEHAL